MIVLLKIGYETWALPDDKGVATVLKCLSKAQRCVDNRCLDRGIELKAETPECTMEILRNWRFTNKPKQPDIKADCFPRGLPAPEPKTIEAQYRLKLLDRN